MEVAAGLIKLNAASITAPNGNTVAKPLLDLRI
jgi:hypothetical protein